MIVVVVPEKSSAVLPSGYIRSEVIKWLEENVSPTTDMFRYRHIAISSDSWVYARHGAFYYSPEIGDRGSVREYYPLAKEVVEPRLDKKSSKNQNSHIFMFKDPKVAILFKLTWV